MGDIVLEVDVLPNMARCLSMTGIAREVAALCGTALKPPPAGVEARGPAIAGRVKVVIDDAALSPRYAAGLIEGVTVGPAPGWMRRRLTHAGMRPSVTIHTNVAVTISLSASGSRNFPMTETMFSFRARNPSSTSVMPASAYTNAA